MRFHRHKWSTYQVTDAESSLALHSHCLRCGKRNVSYLPKVMRFVNAKGGDGHE